MTLLTVMLYANRILAVTIALIGLGTGAPLPAIASQAQSAEPKVQVQDAERVSAAYRNGYQDGWIDGESAWSQSASFSLNRNGNYGKADRGYTESFGDKSEYKRLYRKGFEEGYGVGYGITVTSRDDQRKD